MPRNLPLFAAALALTLTAWPACADEWTVYSDIGPRLSYYETTYPDLCERHSLGQSFEGRELWALRISDNITQQEDEPEFKYIATMHGDEIVGTKMCMMLIEHLLTGYGSDPQCTNIIDETDLWIVPLMNPDGYDRSPRTRYNAQGFDLNRNFPEYGEPNDPTGRPVEVQLVMNWSGQHTFTCSANFHGGALVVNYPLDNDDPGSQYTDYEDLMQYISETYSQYNLPMWNSPTFYHGVTNGADWYMIWGGMQDWNFHHMGNNEVTIELGNDKQPPASTIGQYWNDNRDAMLAYIETCLIGVRGVVTDAATGDPLPATVRVVGRVHDIYTDPDVGDYHRMLLPGVYDLQFEVDGYDPVTITDVEVLAGEATRLDLALSLVATAVLAPNGGETLAVGEPTTVTWEGDPTAQYHVQYSANYGQAGTITDGFESGVLGPEYTTGGDADWFVTSSQAHSGTYSARAGAIGHNDVTWMTRTVGGGDLSFYWRVSSENNYDYFNFYIDGDREIHASGTSGGWEYFSLTLPAGNHELMWEYDKDYSVSQGDDTAWIDDLQIVEDQTAWTDIIALTAPGAMSTPWTPSEAGDECKVRVRPFYAAGYFGAFDESDGTFVIEAGQPCPADINGDNVVDVLDLLAVLSAWGNAGGPEDINGDGVVDVLDLLEVLSSWGACP